MEDNRKDNHIEETIDTKDKIIEKLKAELKEAKKTIKNLQDKVLNLESSLDNEYEADNLITIRGITDKIDTATNYLQEDKWYNIGKQLEYYFVADDTEIVITACHYTLLDNDDIQSMVGISVYENGWDLIHEYAKRTEDYSVVPVKEGKFENVSEVQDYLNGKYKNTIFREIYVEPSKELNNVLYTIEEDYSDDYIEEEEKDEKDENRDDNER